jgi:hypothetical protein
MTSSTQISIEDSENLRPFPSENNDTSHFYHKKGPTPERIYPAPTRAAAGGGKKCGLSGKIAKTRRRLEYKCKLCYFFG